MTASVEMICSPAHVKPEMAKYGLLFGAAQTGGSICEKLFDTNRWKPNGPHPCLTTATGNIMSKAASSDHATTDHLSERVHKSVDHIAETAAKAEERIRHEAEDVSHKAKEYSEKTVSSVTVFVHENPLMALGIAFAAGALVTALRRRT